MIGLIFAKDITDFNPVNYTKRFTKKIFQPMQPLLNSEKHNKTAAFSPDAGFLAMILTDLHWNGIRNVYYLVNTTDSPLTSHIAEPVLELRTACPKNRASF